MEYVAVAFRMRSETIAFSGFLSKYGIPNQIVNTPKSAGVGCGLSVKISKANFQIVKMAVLKVNAKSFAGFFLVTVKSGDVIVKSI